ncbi:MAG: transcription elongation factor GreA [Candidatus Moranbacteria bacterium]|nr:transcription elongation factor GreA [Candidatus Moranbacteria bacterium]
MSDDNKVNKYLTKEGLQKIKKELEERKGPIRRGIALAIKEAKEQGDLSENAEYAEAKAREVENEKRISELESIFKNSVVVKRDSKSKKVGIGSVVRLVSDKNIERIFYIVGSDEADPTLNKISNESPIGSALMHKMPGDKISVEVPGGNINYEILSVENK